MSLWPRGDDTGDGEVETKEIKVEKSAPYTEHDAVARFVDGTEREYTFDGMEHGDTGIVLKHYLDAHERQLSMIGMQVHFSKEAFMTIPYANLKDFETVERRDKEITYTTTEEQEVDK